MKDCELLTLDSEPRVAWSCIGHVFGKHIRGHINQRPPQSSHHNHWWSIRLVELVIYRDLNGIIHVSGKAAGVHRVSVLYDS